MGPTPNTQNIAVAQPSDADPQDSPAGYLWFTEAGPGFGVADISTDGVVTQFGSVGVTLHGITASTASANLFFTAPAANEIFEMDTAALPVVFIFKINVTLTPNSMPWEITTIFPNQVWFTEQNANQIGELVYPGPTLTSSPSPRPIASRGASSKGRTASCSSPNKTPRKSA